MKRFALPVAAVLAAAAAALPATSSALPVVSPACNPDAAEQVLRDAGREDLVSYDEQLIPFRCVDVDRDGFTDSVFAIASGGSGGAFHWAFVVGDPDAELGARLVTVRRVAQGHVSVAARPGLVEVGTPIYRRADPNCCPKGGYKVRRYRWDDRTGALKAAGTKRYETAPKRFRR